jgi:hypothetical protein
MRSEELAAGSLIRDNIPPTVPLMEERVEVSTSSSRPAKGILVLFAPSMGLRLPEKF